MFFSISQSLKNLIRFKRLLFHGRLNIEIQRDQKILAVYSVVSQYGHLIGASADKPPQSGHSVDLLSVKFEDKIPRPQSPFESGGIRKNIDN